MQEEHVIPAPDNKSPGKSPKGLSGKKKALIVVAVIIVALLVGGGTFWFGSQRRGQEAEPSPTPTPTESPTPEGTEEPEITPTASPTSTPTPTPTPTPTTETKTITSTASLDGFRASNGGGNDSHNIRAGRNVNLITRGFISFDISSLPSAAVIESATLRLYQYDIKGNPYGVGARIMVDHLDYDNSLGNEDYGASSISASFVTLTSNATIEWKDANVADAVKNDLSNGRSRSQYRIHFVIESIGGDVTGDFAYFESAENTGGTGNTPQLVIKYH